jgi:SAM-dependent methyltransferase
MGTYWAEIADKNQAESQILFLKNHLTSDGIVLDVACGTGRHLIPLTAMGFEMVGLDLSVKLLRITKQRYPQAQILRGDLRFLPFKSGAFKAAISMDTSLGYLTSEKQDLESLIELRKVLGHGNVLVLDVFNREHLMRKYSQRSFFKRLKWRVLPLLLKLHNRWVLFRIFKWREYSSFFLLQNRTVSRSGDLLCDLWLVWAKVTKNFLIFEHRVRLYRKIKLETFFNSLGFTVKAVYGGYDEQEFNIDNPRLIMVTTG